LTFRHKLFGFPVLEESYPDGLRHYKLPSGKLVRSVTTIIGEKTDKSFLEKWKKRIGEENARQITSRSANKGTAIHSLCEKYLLNDPNYKRGAMPINLNLFNKIKPYLDKHLRVVCGLECQLYSDTLMTAGRCDCLAVYRDKLSIIDFKGSLRPKKEADIEHYFIQEATYAMMAEELFGYEVSQLVTLMAPDHEDCLEFIQPKSKYISKVKEFFCGASS
jgi:hypothetical protein